MKNLQEKIFYAIILAVVTLLTSLIYFKGGLELVILIGLIVVVTNQIINNNAKD